VAFSRKKSRPGGRLDHLIYFLLEKRLDLAKGGGRDAV